ncbi:MFS transporter [Alicyclobacillus sp. ALC3]|uniref:MFS transporter n=1 Tax=Alicyclobacillus sp. ALC3 TaxID=2796143 RepID=UPI0023799A53|nr:MFS transporter [Alicyclobacillus sp. ALC3]WDL99780.1 MFS transporter [Alicyclobacillus sp. ALC3]
MRKRSWLTPIVWGFSLASLFSDMGHELVTALTPGFLVALGAPAIALGLIEGVSGLAQSFAGLRGGRDAGAVTNRRPWLIVGYAGTVLKCLYALVSVWPWLVLLRTVAWIARGFRGPLRDSLIVETVPPEALGRALGFREAMDTVGALIGPLLAVFLLGALGYSKLFWLSALPSLLSVLAIAVFVRDPRQQSRKTADTARGTPADGSQPTGNARLQLRSLPSAYRSLLAADTMFAMGNVAPTFFILAATTALAPAYGTKTAAIIGIALYAWHNVVYSLTAVIAGTAIDRVGSRPVLLAGYAILFVALVGFAAAPAAIWFYAILFTLTGLSTGTQDAAQKTYVSLSLTDPVKGSGLGLHAAMLGIGALVSAALAGGVWTLGSHVLAFALAAVFALAGFVWLAARVPNLEAKIAGK